MGYGTLGGGWDTPGGGVDPLCMVSLCLEDYAGPGAGALNQSLKNKIHNAKSL